MTTHKISYAPDPVLQKAVKEIAAICEKYDIGCHITLASQTHGEYLLQFPSWSKAQVENGEIRFKSKGKDEDRTTLASVHMLQVFYEQGRTISQFVDHLLEMIGSKMLISGGTKRVG